MLRVCRIRQCFQEIGVAWSAADIFGRTCILSIQTDSRGYWCIKADNSFDLDLVTPVITVVVDVDKRLA
jgi:hypothetical protein